MLSAPIQLLSCVIIKSSAHIGHTHLDLSGVGVSPESDGHGELLHVDRQRPQFPGEDKVKQRPELSQVVLHGAPRQDDPMRCGELGVERRLNREPPTYTEGSSHRFVQMNIDKSSSCAVCWFFGVSLYPRPLNAHLQNPLASP